MVATSSMYKTPAQYRKDVYDLLSGFGINLSPQQHHQLSDALKATNNNPPGPKSPVEAIEHRITCPKCQALKIRFGKHFKDYRKMIRKAGGDDTEQV